MKQKSYKERAILCRKKGYSYGMITSELGISKSTLSGWLKDIPYTPSSAVIKRIGDARARMAQTKHNQKVASIISAKQRAKKELGKLTKRDLWLLGIGLYLGEGDKSSNEAISIMNSDPEIVRVSIQWFKDVCGLSTDNFAPVIHLYPDNNIAKEINYWSKITKIPKKQFRKSQVDRRTNKSEFKKGKLPHGTLMVRIISNGKKEFGVLLHRSIMGWLEAALKEINAGIV